MAKYPKIRRLALHGPWHGQCREKDSALLFMARRLQWFSRRRTIHPQQRIWSFVPHRCAERKPASKTDTPKQCTTKPRKKREKYENERRQEKVEISHAQMASPRYHIVLKPCCLSAFLCRFIPFACLCCFFVPSVFYMLFAFWIFNSRSFFHGLTPPGFESLPLICSNCLMQVQYVPQTDHISSGSLPCFRINTHLQVLDKCGLCQVAWRLQNGLQPLPSKVQAGVGSLVS